MNPCLPQNETNEDKSTRFDYLNRQQQAYKYDYNYLEPLVLIDEVPAAENFSVQYIAERVAVTAEIVPNMLSARVKSFLDPLDDIQDYEDFFTLLPLPEVAEVYQTDDSFAEQRLSGVNPLVLCLLSSDDDRAKVLENIPSFKESFEPLFHVSQELSAGNIYIADYTGNDSRYRGPSFVQGGTHAKGRKYLPKPMAFFWWRRYGVSDRGKLVPIAIQLDSNPNSLYTPFEKNPLDWLFAKLCVQIADGNHHEMNSHLCRTHFVMEPIAIGTARQLAENHPLSLLLRPHFRFMLTNNHLGQQRLINPDGPVDTLLAGTLGESMELVKDAYRGWNLRDFAFPKEIENRGMDKKDDRGNFKLPHYPYRDDGMLVWEAIHTFVSDYLSYFYPAPVDIAQDTELQAWAKELSDPENGGKVKGMPANFTTVEDLIEIVTTIIFICGPQHSAVNFAQYEYMTFAANMPLAAYRDIPEIRCDASGVIKKEAISDQDILKLLPPYKRTADQLQSLFTLAAYRYDQLGYYDKSFQDLYGKKFKDVFKNEESNNGVIISILGQFQQNLNMVEQEIDASNRKRVVPYPYLKPSLILNSISI